VRIRDIVITGNPVLHRSCTKVEHFDDQLKDLVQDMFATMELAPGVGLAAPQVGVDLALFVYDWVDEDDIQHRGVAINPMLSIEPLPIGPLDEEEELEGCLSVPGERFPLRRSDRVTLTATNLDGNEFTVHADGWLARIFQHEFDHLLGVLYVDRLVEPHHTEARDAINQLGWGVPGFSWLPGRDHLED
jgi:peptide deformylase